MNSKPNKKRKNPSKAPDQKVLIMLFYPYTLAMITSGFAALITILIGYSLHLAATIALGFFAFASSSLYFITKPAIKSLNVREMFISFTIIADILALLSFVTLIFSYIG